MSEQMFSIFSNCHIVKGAKRSVICDLHRRRIDFIPNALYYILSNYKKHTISEIKKKFNNENDAFIDEYFDFMITNEYGFFIDKKEKKLFPPIELKFDLPSIISNCILDINDKTKINFKSVFQQLKLLRTYFVELRFFSVFNFDELKTLLEKCNTIETHLHLIISYDKTFTVENLKFIFAAYNVSAVSMYNFPQKMELEYDELKKFNFSSSQNKIQNNLSCGQINPAYFTVNKDTFMESQKHNNCLNRKVSIDANGEIKNCPSMEKSYGNIKDTTLEEALNKKGFKNVWNINKDRITICKDCEFRHICTDCRAYIEKPDDIYSKPLKCGYDPYTAKWEEWSTNPLKQKAIEYYGLQNFKI